MVKKSLRQFTLMATATVTLLLGSVPLYAQTAGRTAKTCRIRAAVREADWVWHGLTHTYNSQILYRADEALCDVQPSKVMARGRGAEEK